MKIGHTLRHALLRLKRDEGQDLIEYTLLLAFVCLTSAALVIGTGTSVRAIWTVTSTQLTNATSAAS